MKWIKKYLEIILIFFIFVFNINFSFWNNFSWTFKISDLLNKNNTKIKIWNLFNLYIILNNIENKKYEK